MRVGDQGKDHGLEEKVVISSILWLGDALFISKFKVLIQEVVLNIPVKLYPCPVNSRKFHPDPTVLGGPVCELARIMML